MKFQGRVGIAVLGLIFIINLFAFYEIRNEEKSTAILLILIFLVMDAFFLNLTFKNHTTISDEDLITVHMGVFKSCIPCSEIISIKRTRSPLASMSMSFKRLDIKYKRGQVLMSVKDELTFLNELVKRNPRIQIL